MALLASMKSSAERHTHAHTARPTRHASPQAIRGPDFDYYKFGNDFVDTLMITEDSTTEGVDALSDINTLVEKVRGPFKI